MKKILLICCFLVGCGFRYSPYYGQQTPIDKCRNNYDCFANQICVKTNGYYQCE